MLTRLYASAHTFTTAAYLGTDHVRAAAIFLFLALSVVISLYQIVPPQSVPASAPPADFSSGRAMQHLRAIAQNPRPIGSSEHARVRAYIMKELVALGLSPETQKTTAVSPWQGPIVVTGAVENIIVRLKGTEEGKAVLLMGHYDSVPMSPGASDNGSAVAIMLETLRALKAREPLKNEVIFLFTDGEEVGLLGAKAFVDDFYKKVAVRWRQRVSEGSFMKKLSSGVLPRAALRTFFKNWGSYTIEINTLEAASYHKHISFFRKHRDLMGPMAQKLADELIYPKPPGHVYVVLETARALGISEDEIFLEPMLPEFRAKIDFKRSILWEGTIAEFYAAGATEEQTGYWSADCFKALTTHYGLTPEQAVYFSTHEEADLKEHAGGVMGHGSFRRMVLQRLLEDAMAYVRPGYTLEYCGLTAVDLHGVILQSVVDAATP